MVAIFESDTDAAATSIASALVGLASDGSSDGQSDGSVAAVATSVGFGGTVVDILVIGVERSDAVAGKYRKCLLSCPPHCHAPLPPPSNSQCFEPTVAHPLRG